VCVCVHTYTHTYSCDVEMGIFHIYAVNLITDFLY